jgi:hypothetical protein
MVDEEEKAAKEESCLLNQFTVFGYGQFTNITY